MAKDKTSEDENQLDEKKGDDSSDQLATAVDWERDRSRPVQTQLALADGGEDERRHKSPFGQKKADAPKPDSPKPDAPIPGKNDIPPAKPSTPDVSPKVEQVSPKKDSRTEAPVAVKDAADKVKSENSKLEKVADPEFLKSIPQGTLNSTQRAFEALKTVEPGKELTVAQRKAFEDALKDAAKPLPTWVSDHQQKLIDDVQSKVRVMQNGVELPPWTPEKEKQFVLNLRAVQKAVGELSPDAQKRVGELEGLIGQLPKSDTVRRGVFQRMLDEEGKKDPKIAAYLDQKNQMDKFTVDNAAGLVRRNMHQQDMSVLHSYGVVSGLYAIALDRAGQKSDQKQIETLLKDSVRDRFAPANIPEIIQLVDKYKLDEKETQSVEAKVHGYGDMKKAQQIMADASLGTVSERLAKAREHFEKAIGAADLVDQKKTNEEIEELTKKRIVAGDSITGEKLNQMEDRAVELVAKARLGFEARLSYALALQQASVQTKDASLNEQSINMLKSIENIDPAYKLDPTVQGALIIAQRKPAENIDLNAAAELGKPAVEKIKEEMIKAGGKPEDKPGWLRALTFAGETLAGILAFHLVGKYVFKPIGNLKNYVSRSWEMSSRVKRVEAEQTPSLKPGEEPRLTLKTKDGKEYPVEGVRNADGRLRVNDGGKTAVIKPGRGDLLYVKVAPDSNLSKEQVRELAAQKLKPVGDEAIIAENQQRHQEELAIREREIEQLKAANEELQRKLAGEGQNAVFEPTPPDKLAVPKELLNERAVKDFHDHIERASGDMRSNPSDAGLRLRDAVFDFMQGAGIKDANLHPERVDFVVNKDGTKVEISYSTGDGAESKPVSKVEGKFFLGDGKTELPADKVQTKISVPEGLIRGNVGELSKSVYVALLEQTNRGNSSSARTDRAGMNDFVAKSLEKHVVLPSDVGTTSSATAGAASLEITRLPEGKPKVAELEISERGVRIGGTDRDLSFVEVWSEKVKDLESRLAAEEGKQESERDQKRIAELKASIESENRFIAQLSDAKHPEHAKAKERAAEAMRGFRASEGELDRLAKEKGPGGEVRGRMVALAILASAFLAWREKSAADKNSSN